MPDAGGMAIDVATFQTHLDAARTAIGTGDYATAYREAMQAQACLAGMPDGEADGMRTTWRETVSELLKTIREAQASAGAATAGGVTRTKVTYARATS